MRIVLEIANGPRAGRKTRLREFSSVRVGRDEPADITVPEDGRLSKSHFSLEYKLGVCRVRDLESSNGTFVNGRRVTEAVLNDGDTILAGETKFRVYVESPPGTPADGASTPKSTREATDQIAAPPVPVNLAPTIRTSSAVSSVEPQASVSRPQSRPAVREEPRPQPPAPQAQPEFPPYQLALEDPDALVRREALLAAVWNRQEWVLKHCRDVAARILADQTPLHALDAIWLLAVLGEPNDLKSMLALGEKVSLGHRRFEILSAFGHPAVVPSLLKAMTSPDPLTAASAGTAFQMLTGVDVSSDQHVEVQPPEGQADEFEAEFADEVVLPDVRLATEQWQRLERPFTAGQRWRQGFDLSGPADAAILGQLNMASRYEARLRDNFRGHSQGSPMDLERFRLSNLD